MSETFRSVVIKFPKPKPHTNKHTNTKGPIVSIELMTSVEIEAGKTFVTSVYWVDDGLATQGGGPTAFYSLGDLCRAYNLNLNEITDTIARAFVERAGTDL